MRAVLYIDKEEGTAVSDVPDPSPGPDDVVVSVDACGLCGSDVHSVQNGQCAPGQILGHEFSGRIVALGAGRDRLVRGAGGGRLAARVVRQVPDLRARAAVPLPRRAEHRDHRPGRVRAVRRGAGEAAGGAAAGAAAGARVARRAAVGRVAGGQAVGAGPGDPVLVYGVGPIGLYSIMALGWPGPGRSSRPGGRQGGGRRPPTSGADVVIDTREISVAEYADAVGHAVRGGARVLRRAWRVQRGARGAPSLAAPCVEVALTPEAASLPLFAMISEGQHIVGAVRVLRRDLPGVGRAPRGRAGAGGTAGVGAGVAG